MLFVPISHHSQVLLSDAIGPAYAQLLTVAAKLLASPRDLPLFWSLWPNDVTPVEPWAAAYQGLFRHVARMPVLRHANQWICAKDAVLIEDHGGYESNDASRSDDDHGSVPFKHLQQQQQDKEQPPATLQVLRDEHRLSLRQVLLTEGLPVVAVPPLLCKALVSQGAVRAQAGPAFVRHHFRVAESAASSALSSSSSSPSLSPWLTPKEVAVHPCIDPTRAGVETARRNALLLLAEACRDLHLNLPERNGASGGYANRTNGNGSSGSSQYGDARGVVTAYPERFRVLHGLGLLPLANGAMGRLCLRSQNSSHVGLLNGVEFEDRAENEETSVDEDHSQWLLLVEGTSAHKLMAALPDVVVSNNI